MTTTERIIPRSSGGKAKVIPTIIQWGKNSTGQPNRMLRAHSINACVDDIYESSKSMGFIKVNLIGASSSENHFGKSNLSPTA